MFIRVKKYDSQDWGYISADHLTAILPAYNGQGQMVDGCVVYFLSPEDSLHLDHTVEEVMAMIHKDKPRNVTRKAVNEYGGFHPQEKMNIYRAAKLGKRWVGGGKVHPEFSAARLRTYRRLYVHKKIWDGKTLFMNEAIKMIQEAT